MVRNCAVAGAVFIGAALAVPANAGTAHQPSYDRPQAASSGRAFAEVLIEDGVARMVRRAASAKHTNDLAPQELLSLYLLASLKGAGNGSRTRE